MIATPRAILASLLIPLSLSPSRGQARSLILSDFDNTIVESRQEYAGTFKTKFRLFRVEMRNSTLEPVARGPEFIDISPADFHRAFKDLAPSATQTQSINMRFTLEDGRVFTPGHYYIRPRSTYLYYFAPQSLSEPSPLTADLKSALKAKDPLSWQGPFFPYVEKILATAEGRTSFGMITARGHSPLEWQGFFNLLRQRKLLPGVPSNLSLIHNIADPHYDGFGIDGAVRGRKIEVLREAILSLAQVPLDSKSQIISANGDRSEPGHVLVFAEDNQEILDSAVSLFQSFARRRNFPIKFVVFNSGYQREVIASQRPQFAVVKSDGSFRALSEIELSKEIFFGASAPCRDLLRSGRRPGGAQ